MASQAQRREATRNQLIAAARACFVEYGYEGAAMDAVLARAGVSKGALYHHFESKADLMAAVFETVTREVAGAANAAVGVAPKARDRLADTLKAWLRTVSQSPEARGILLHVGPQVLGYARARRLEEEITLPALRRRLEEVVAAGEAACEDCDLTARLLSATVAELALAAQDRDLRGAGLAPLNAALDAVLDALLRPLSAAPSPPRRASRSV